MKDHDIGEALKSALLSGQANALDLTSLETSELEAAIARAKGLGKGIRQVKDATQEIKTEIQKSAKSKGVNTKSISDQIDKVKEDIDDITGSIKRDL